MTSTPQRTAATRVIRLAALTAGTAALTIGGAGAALADAAPAAAAQDASVTSAEREMLTTVNDQRASVGCDPVTRATKLDAAAGAHASDMVERDYFSHDSSDGEDPFERAKRFGTTANAENIAAGDTSGTETAVGLWNSPGHRANIANCDLTEIGIGYDPGQIDITNNAGIPIGAGSWVQLFAR